MFIRKTKNDHVTLENGMKWGGCGFCVQLISGWLKISTPQGNSYSNCHINKFHDYSCTVSTIFIFLSFGFGRFFILIKHISKSGFGKYVKSTPCMFFFFGHLSIFSFQYQLLESMIILLLKLTYFMFINKYDKIHIIFYSIFFKNFEIRSFHH